jgi:STE24 endopeptidase
MGRFLRIVLLGAACGLAVVAAALSARAAEPGAEAESDLMVRITPEMVRYSYTRYALYFVGTAVHAAALWWLLRSGFSARLRDLAERRGRNGLTRALIYYPLLTAAYGLITLPLAFYSSFLLPHQFGLSTQSAGGWALDRAKSWALTAGIGAGVVALLFWTLRRSPTRWWFGFWLLSIPLLVGATLLGPLVVDPLFNRFQPLANERLRERLLALAARAGIEGGRVFEVDASRRTTGVNAYVTGVGGSARIVLWDTLIERLDEDEVAFVMAHEMGHYAEGHVPLLLLTGCAGSLVLLFAVDRAGRALVARRGPAWGVRGLDDLAALPVFLLLLLALNFVGSPVESAVSRHFETRADDFALRLTGDGRTGARAYVKLAEKNLSHPEPPAFIEYWMFSHPPLNKRIRRALDAGE